MDTILLILGASCLSVLAVASEPTNYLYHLLKLDKPSAPGIQGALSRLLSCCLCTGFWVSLIITENILLAAICAVIAELISVQLKKQ